MSDYRDLLVWRKAVSLAVNVYHVTATFPKDERFGLVSQARRAAVSVASNVAEGQGRGSDGHFIQFLGTARGSLHELETQLTLAGKLGFLSNDVEENLMAQTAEVGRLTSALINSLEKQAKHRKEGPH